MQNIRWKAFALIFSLCFICLIIAAIEDLQTALIVFSFTVLIYLCHHLFWIGKLAEWYKKPQAEVPQGSGVWEDISQASTMNNANIKEHKTN